MPAPPDLLRRLADEARSGWLGCDWPTSFGKRNLELSGLRSRHALLAAKATRGDEAACWLEAAKWLETVENDAAEAASLADQALRSNEAAGSLEPIDCLLRAERLEAKYRDPVVYRKLREAWQTFFVASR